MAPDLLQRFAPDGLVGLELKGDYSAGRDWRDDQLKYIVGIKTLSELDLSKNQSITAAGIVYIDQLPALSKLDLTDTRVNGRDLTSLKNLAHLKRLCINDNKNLSPLFQFMAQAPSKYQLKCFVASNSGIKDDDLLSLSKIKSINELRLSGNEITARGLDHLPALPELQVLMVKANPLDASAQKCFDNMKALRELEVSEGVFSGADLKAFRLKHQQCAVAVKKKRLKFADFGIN